MENDSTRLKEKFMNNSASHVTAALPTKEKKLTDDRIYEIIKESLTEIDNDPPEAVFHAVKMALREFREPQLGCATTKELIDELAARADVSLTIGEKWPAYRTIDRD